MVSLTCAVMLTPLFVYLIIVCVYNFIKSVLHHRLIPVVKKETLDVQMFNLSITIHFRLLQYRYRQVLVYYVLL